MALYVDTARDLIGRVKDIKPNAGSDSCLNWLNKRIRNVCTKTHWSDLLRFGMISIPAAYTTGTVTTATGSTVVTGALTAWTVNDEINTTSPKQVIAPGFQVVKPASMTSIVPGKWLLLDNGTADQEAVAVEHVTADGFYANITHTHSAGFAITKSSLAGRQFRTTYPFFTVIAVLDATTLWLDMPWGAAAQTGVAYRIQQAYFSPDPNAWRLKHAWDPVQGIPLDVDTYTFEDIIIGDPQMTSTDNPVIAVPVPPGGGGVAQWFLYPPQSSSRQIGAVYSTLWPKMVTDGDRPPWFLNCEIFVSGAIADALRTKIIPRDGRQDPYYDPEAALFYEQEYAAAVDQAVEADEPRAAKMLQSYARKTAGFLSATYIQSHPGWPTMWPG